MRRIIFASLILAASALAADTGAELFQKALTAERAAGNLEEAIKLYQQVAKEFASDRALAAKAIVQEARCYEKLGQNKAIQLYEQVAREYKDQPEPSATATARLVALKLGDRPVGPAGMNQRRINLPFSDSVPHVLETDGRRQVYVDAATGALMISDLAGKDRRVVFKPRAGERIGAHLVTRDLSIVYLYLQKADGSAKGVVIKTDGTGYREFGEDPAPADIAPDRSWDDGYVFTCVTDAEGTRQLLRRSITDGEIRKVPMACGKMNRPSPDGRFLGISESYMRLAKVFVAPIQGGEPQLVSDNARVIDWTRDGRYLIVDSARFGVEGTYLLPMREGRQSGEPILLRYGPCEFGSVNADGSLVCPSALPSGNSLAWLGAMDLGRRSVEWSELNLRAPGGHWFFTAWSPDSSQFAYYSWTEGNGPNETGVVRLHDLVSGEEREAYKGGGYPACAWPGNARLTCTREQTSRIEVFSVALDSGRVESQGSVPGFDGWPFLSSDGGRAIYIGRQPGEELIRWEVATRQATTVDRLPGLYTRGDSIPDPSEHWIARRNKDMIEIRPTPGGQWRPLISLAMTHMAFTPDGNWLLFHSVDAAGQHGLFRVSTAGGQPERIGDFPSVPKDKSALYVSPDGRTLLAGSSTGYEVWILENFEPKQTAAR